MAQDRSEGMADAEPYDAEPYAVTAEFYDILQGESERRLADRRFASAARAARVGIVDVGAGTGIVTEILLARSAAPIHAVEPSTPMRVALLTRLAALRADARARVTVHAETLQRAGLTRVADLVVCANVAGVVEPAQRRMLWRAAAEALVAGGVILVDSSPAAVSDGPTHRDLPPVRVGSDTYHARVRIRPDRGLVSVTYLYRVERDGEAVREEREEFTMWPATIGIMQEELRQAGFAVAGSADDGILRATLDPAAA